MRILVTGAAGFIGNHVAGELAERGHRVIAVDGHPTRRSRYGHPVRTDCADPEVLHRIRSAEFDAVVHLAAIVDTTSTNRDEMLMVNTEKSLALADSSCRGGAVFVYASSTSVYGTIEPGVYVREEDVGTSVSSGPLNVYAESKLLLDTEMIDQHSGSDWPWAGLRFTNVFGPGEHHKGPMASYLQQMLSETAHGRPIVLFDDTLKAARELDPGRNGRGENGSHPHLADAIGRLQHGIGPSHRLRDAGGVVRRLLRPAADRGARAELVRACVPVLDRGRHEPMARCVATRQLPPRGN